VHEGSFVEQREAVEKENEKNTAEFFVYLLEKSEREKGKLAFRRSSLNDPEWKRGDWEGSIQRPIFNSEGEAVLRIRERVIEVNVRGRVLSATFSREFFLTREKGVINTTRRNEDLRGNKLPDDLEPPIPLIFIDVFLQLISKEYRKEFEAYKKERGK